MTFKRLAVKNPSERCIKALRAHSGSSQMTLSKGVTIAEGKGIAWKVLTKGFGISVTPEALESLIKSSTDVETFERRLLELSRMCKKGKITLVTMESLRNMTSTFSVLSDNSISSGSPKSKLLLEYFPLSDASLMQHYWNHYKKKFETRADSEQSAKHHNVYIERFYYLWNLCESFHDKKGDIDSIAPLVRSTSSISGTSGTEVSLFGTITISKSGSITLEDPDGTLDLNFSGITYVEGIITPGIMVLVTGNKTPRGFRVSKILQPPISPLEKSTSVYSMDIWNSSKKAFCDAGSWSSEAIVVAADINPSDPVVLGNIERLFDGFDQPGIGGCVFILSISIDGPKNIMDYQKMLKTFDDLISSRQYLLKDCQFIVIPDFKWPSAEGSILFSPFLSLISHPEILKKSNITMLPNPSRIRYRSRYDIMFVNYPYMSVFSKHNIFCPKAGDLVQFYDQILFTCHRQRHLIPFSQEIQQLAQKLDQSRMIPIPDVVFVSDPSFSTTHTPRMIGDTKFVSVGSFSATSTFVVYYPSEQRCEQR